MIFRAGFIAILLPSLVAGAADTKLNVMRGWGQKERAGRWDPILVTASSPVPRNVVCEVVSPHQGSFAMAIRERFAIGPEPATFQLFAPTYYSPFDETVVVLRDADSGKKLAQYPPESREGPPTWPGIGGGSVVVGVAGQRAVLESQLSHLGIVLSNIPEFQLPRSPIGFDAMDVLFLNRADLTRLDAQQQESILNWVRGGGGLLIAPGNSPLPPDSPLPEALPCRIGAVAKLDLGPEILQRTGLQPRFAHMAARTLEPNEGSKQIELFKASGVNACVRRYGFGTILVSPIDLADLQFDAKVEAATAPEFWKPIFAELTRLPDEKEKTQPAYYNGSQSESPDQQREGTATDVLCNFIGNVPGAGRFGFSYVAGALIAMMIVVGPVDWFVLKRLGYQPWTWATTGGWIALITLAAVYAGFLFKSGDLYFRTVRVIDQIDGASVGTSDLMGIYSPRTRQYAITPQPYVLDGPAGWWEPVVPGVRMYGYYSNGPKNDVEFHQSDTANVPEPLIVNVWNLRFLRSQTRQPGPPIVEASLSYQNTPKGPRVTGTIKNVSDHGLRNIHVRVRKTMGDVSLNSDGLAAGQSIHIDAVASQPFPPKDFSTQYENFGYYGQRHNDSVPAEQDLWPAAPDLSGRRATKIDALLDSGTDFACIYGEVLNPRPAAKLEGDAPRIEQHFQWVRAVVPVSESSSK